MRKKWLQLTILALVAVLVVGGGYLWTSRGEIPEEVNGGDEVVGNENQKEENQEKEDNSKSYSGLGKIINSTEWEIYENRSYGFSFKYPKELLLHGSSNDMRKEVTDNDYLDFYVSFGLLTPGTNKVLVSFVTNSGFGHGNDTLSYAKKFIAAEKEKGSVESEERVNYEMVKVNNLASTKVIYQKDNKAKIRLFFPIKNELYLIVKGTYENPTEKELIEKIIDTLII